MLMQNEGSVPSSASATMAANSSESKHGSSESPLDDLRQAAHEMQDRNGQHHPIAEFLYQLTKMLTDDNSEIIEWSEGRIRVHHPDRLEAEVLHKYFRHSKFASFQRQLNYFGFRKIAGKGKMSPCSYVNDAATSDIRSLLLIKRKTNGSAARKAAMQQRAAAITGNINPALAGMNLQALASATGQPLGVINNQALSSAMALLQENALRAGLGQMPAALQQGNAAGLAGTAQQLGLLALQQQQQQLQELQNQQMQQSFQQKQAPSASQQLLQQQQQQQQQQPSAIPSSSSQSQQQQQQASSSSQQAPAPTPNAPQSMDQLQAQLAALAGQSGANTNALNLAASMPALASLKLAAAAAAQNNSNNNSSADDKNHGNSSDSAAINPASAALSAQTSSMPATAAMQDAAATGQNPANLFDSTANLRSLLNEHNGGAGANNNLGPDLPGSSGAAAAAAAAARPGMNSMASQALLNRLPSSGTIFPENSILNFGNMLGSSNRLSSLLSLNSFMGSREASLVDLAAGTHMAAAAGAAAAAGSGPTTAQQLQAAMADSSKFRSNAP